jgi:GNAT superfamily N-acetyltransferase
LWALFKLPTDSLFTSMLPLFNSWRSFLAESILPDYSTLALTIFERSETSLLAFLLFDPSKLLSALSDRRLQELILSQKSDKPVSRLVDYSRAFIGTLMVNEKPPSQPCMGAREVSYSAVSSQYQGKGYGKLLYTAAMQHVKSSLMPDRDSVSDDAARVWNSFDRDPSIEKEPENKPPYIGQFDNYENPKTEPKNDDCSLHPNPTLNKAYTSEGSGVLRTLVANNTKFETSALRLDKKAQLMYKFYMQKRSAIASNVFQREYAKEK